MAESHNIPSSRKSRNKPSPRKGHGHHATTSSRESGNQPSPRKGHGPYPGPGATPLDPAAILDQVGPGTRPLISHIDVVEETGSTNDDLLGLAPTERHGRVVLAERQTAGRGRRGRPWQSPAGNIWLSVGWRFRAAPNELSQLPLLAGVCVCRALARCGLGRQRIKPPNDILVDGAKLAGILVETRGGRAGRDSVTGIGLNVQVPDVEGRRIDQAWTDLRRLLGARLPARNRVVALILEELLARYSDEGGLSAFLADAWPRWALVGDPTHG